MKSGDPDSKLESWWLARGVGVRKALQLALLAVAGLCGFSFFRFERTNELTPTLERTGFTVGKPDPWFRWLKIREQTEQGFALKQERGIRFFTLSFGAGLLCYGSIALLIGSVRIGTAQRPRQAR